MKFSDWRLQTKGQEGVKDSVSALNLDACGRCYQNWKELGGTQMEMEVFDFRHVELGALIHRWEL